MPIRNRVGAGLLAAIGMALVSTFTGCNSSDTSPYPLVEVTPASTVRGLYASGSHQDFRTGDYLMYPIDLTTSGVLDILVDWTFKSSWIYVYFGDTRCSYDELSNHTCRFLISSETVQPKPRLLTTQKLPVGQYYLVFYNVPWDARTRTGTDNTESIVYEVNLTVTTASGERQPVRVGEPIVVAGPRR